MNSGISARLHQVTQSIRDFEARYGRELGSVELLAVSKTKPVAAIREAMDAGQLSFGENYVAEGLEKIQQIGHNTADGSALTWHFIGAIQSRKTRDIANHFDWAHGVDRLKVATRLSQARIDAEKPPLNVCLQVALDDEAGKAGIDAAALPELAQAVAQLPGLHLRGLMAIPAPRQQFSEQREVFARLAKLFKSLRDEHPQLDTLSCGMSGDLEAAVAEGASIVRVGTAIFGAR